MKIFEITKKEVIELIDGLDEKTDQATLTKIYNSGKYEQIKMELEKVNKTVLKHLDEKQRSLFNKIFLLNGIESPFNDIMEYFRLLSTNRISSEKLKKTNSGLLSDLVSEEMSNNSVFKNTLSEIVDSSRGTASGFGKGELFFMVYGKDATKLSSKEHADVSLDGWKIEIKGKGAALNPVSGKSDKQNVNIVDSLNSNLKKMAEQFKINLSIQSGKNNPTNPSSGWFPEFFKQLARVKNLNFAVDTLSNYLKELYDMDDSSAKNMAKSIFPLLGETDSNRVWAKFVIDNSKKHSNWQSTIIINTDGTKNDFPYVNITSGENLPNDLIFKPVLTKAKGTYAYPDGALMVSIRDGGNSEERERKKQELIKNLDFVEKRLSELGSQIQPYQKILPLRTVNSIAKKFSTMYTTLDKKQQILNTDNSKMSSYKTQSFLKNLSSIEKQIQKILKSINSNSTQTSRTSNVNSGTNKNSINRNKKTQTTSRTNQSSNVNKGWFDLTNKYGIKGSQLAGMLPQPKTINDPQPAQIISQLQKMDEPSIKNYLLNYGINLDDPNVLQTVKNARPLSENKYLLFDFSKNS